MSTPIEQLPYTDLPGLAESFSDQVRLVHWDGYCLRLEFAVSRPHVTATNQSTSTIYPVARLVLTPAATVNLHQALGQLVAQFEQQGVVKRVAPAPETKQ